MNGPRLAPVIALPVAPTVTAGDLRRAFNVSRQSISIWRARHNFPRPSERRGRTTLTKTAEAAAWAAQRGSTVHWT